MEQGIEMTNLYSTKTTDNLDSCNTNDYFITEDLGDSLSFQPVDAFSEDLLFDFDNTDNTEAVTDGLITNNSNNLDTSQGFYSDLNQAATSDNFTGTKSNSQGSGINSSSDGEWGSPDLWGTPDSDADYWRRQRGNSTCTVVAQMSIYESITGEYISESTAAEYAEDRGWFSPKTGTLPKNTGKILNSFGIKTKQYYDADVNTIIDAMNRGDKVMASIDSNEIWDPTYSRTTGKPYEQKGTAGHTVWVTGVEWNSDDTANFYLNDSGTSSGQEETIDYWDFMNAWDDYDNLLTVVDA
jgi:hypothetical protein